MSLFLKRYCHRRKTRGDIADSRTGKGLGIIDLGRDVLPVTAQIEFDSLLIKPPRSLNQQATALLIHTPMQKRPIVAIELLFCGLRWLRHYGRLSFHDFRRGLTAYLFVFFCLVCCQDSIDSLQVFIMELKHLFL
jgi:hypothetical protein